MASDYPTILLRGREVDNYTEIDSYMNDGGYGGLREALGRTPAEVIETIKASGLRGRGGAGFPTGIKWSFIPKDDGTKYVCVNADESETGTFKDRLIMETNPHQLIEGALICAYAIGAKAVYIYLRGEFWDIGYNLDQRIEQAREQGFIGDNILDSGFSCQVYTHLGAGAYICGEESALLNSLEGLLGQPRVRPPFPANKGGGLYKEPTVVNNVETLANVPWIMRNGPEAYKAIGTEQSAGTKLFCVSGHVQRPGVYEMPFSTTFRELLEEVCGGALEGRKFKAMLPSGGSGPIVPLTDDVLDTPMSYEDTVKIDTIIGSASIIVMDDTVDIAWVANKVTKFFHHESCGKCTPCREGTYWLSQVLDRIMANEATARDIDLIDNVARNMKGITLCALGEFAANPIMFTIKHFREDFMKHVVDAPEGEQQKQLAAAGD